MFFRDTDTIIGKTEIIEFRVFLIAIHNDLASFSGVGYRIVLNAADRCLQIPENRI